MYRPVYRSFGDIAQGVDHFAVPNPPPGSRQQTNMGSLLGEAPIPLPLYDNLLNPSAAERMLNYGEPLSRYVSSDGGDSFASSPSPASPMTNNSVPNLYGLQASNPGSPMLSQYQEGFSNGVAAVSPYSSQSPSSGFDAASPRILPDESQGESSNSGRDHPVICLFPGCDAKPFKRRADLDRHYKHKHAPESQKESYYCDYPKCARRRDPFHRRDHFRDHLREFHKEDIEKRGGTVKEEWLDGRNTSSTWWRCAKCLTRIYVDKSGYECPGCKTTCQPKRKAIRQKD